MLAAFLDKQGGHEVPIFFEKISYPVRIYFWAISQNPTDSLLMKNSSFPRLAAKICSSSTVSVAVFLPSWWSISQPFHPKIIIIICPSWHHIINTFINEANFTANPVQKTNHIRPLLAPCKTLYSRNILKGQHFLKGSQVNSDKILVVTLVRLPASL